MQFSTFERITYISLAETLALNLTLLKTAFCTTQKKQDIRDKELKIRFLLLSWISKLHHKQEPVFPKSKPNTDLVTDTKSHMTASFKELPAALPWESNNVVDDQRVTC